MPTGEPVLFFENDHYRLSLFSAFMVNYKGHECMTGEHAFQADKFFITNPRVAHMILAARSAHDAKRIAKEFKAERDPTWDNRKVDVYEEVQLLRADEHEIVRATLLATGERRLIENSPDPFWGWGKDRRGYNHAGKCLERVRTKLVTPRHH